MENSKSGMSFLNKSAKSILLSVLAGEIVTMLCLFAASLLMTKAGLPLYMADTIVVICASFGSLIAGFIAGMLVKEKGFMHGMCCGLLLCVIMAVFAACSSGFCGGAMTIIKLVSVLLLAIAGGVMGVNKKAKRVKY